ncbi:heavy metal translocating P-type ATPase [Candidatus Lokiarchaeum ossiferum]|uniref:heavy metal translocating P-type ATPase n=1 Tax=Candidatus Lokiarchaeum ossiferum TaxID=2951803 RepID=UPI00352E6DA0
MKNTANTNTFMIETAKDDIIHVIQACDDNDDQCSCTSGCACSQVSLQIEAPEKYNWMKRMVPFTISFILAILGFILEKLSSNQNLNIVYYTIFTVSYGFAAYNVFINVFKNLRIKTIFDENFLMIIASVGAIFTNNFLEAIAVMLFYKLGEIVEGYGVFKSKKSIQSLLENQPEIAHVKIGDKIIDKSPKEVHIGDILLVKPGEKVPLDGLMRSKYSRFDTSVLTGESIPRKIMENEPTLSGMVNLSNLVEIEVNKSFENSTIARIMDLVQNAESNKSQTEKFTKKFAKYYTPIVVIAAVLLAIIPPLVFSSAIFSEWLYRAMIFLVISCPCALVISVPLTYFGGIGGASRHGILIKGTQHLETLVKLDTIVFDKTGTITKGNFTVSDIVPLDGFGSEAFLELVASIEAYSNHPIASSIINFYGKENLTNSPYKIENFKEIPALGIVATIDGKKIIAGNDKILHEFNTPHHHDYCKITGTIVHVSFDNKYLGYLRISDEIKDDSVVAFSNLRKLGIQKMVILSGDEETIVRELAQELKLDGYYAGLMPDEKVEQFERLKPSKNKVAYVGDGINDAPVIARADVGFAMGGFGSDAAIESADVVLMTDAITKIGETIQIAKRTRIINWQNIFLIFLVKGVFLLLGALGLMTMWGAVFADVGMALIAIINSRRMLKFNPIPNKK